MRLIDADAAIDRYYAEYEKQDICDGDEDRDWLKKCIEEAPTIDPESLRTDELTDIDKAMEWLNDYSFADTEQVYTNGTVLVPLFRVKQAFMDMAYNGLMEG